MVLRTGSIPSVLRVIHHRLPRNARSPASCSNTSATDAMISAFRAPTVSTPGRYTLPPPCATLWVPELPRVAERVHAAPFVDLPIAVPGRRRGHVGHRTPT